MSERQIKNLLSGFLLSGNMTVVNEYGSEGFSVRHSRGFLECILFFPYGRNRESFIRSRVSTFAVIHSMSTILRRALTVRTVSENYRRRTLA